MRKKDIAGVLIGVLAAAAISASPVLAKSNTDFAEDKGVQKTTYTEAGDTWIQGMVEEKVQWKFPSPYQTLLLTVGRHVRQPSEGGTWEYGFWNAKVRSYYTVNKKHGSTAVYIDPAGKKHNYRSINTAAGYKSIGEGWALNLPKSNDRYYYRIVK